MNAPVSAPQIHAISRKVSPGVENSRLLEFDRETLTAPALVVEPQRINMDQFRELLMSTVMSGSSDLTIQSDQQIRAEIHGVLYRVTRRPMAPSEVDMILNDIYGSANAKTEINGQEVLDFSYELNLADGSRQRFRVNATGVLGRDERSVEITLRTLPSETPTLEKVGLDLEEVKALSPNHGIVVIAGGTGSGKSTTMAALTRSHLENVKKPVKIVDIQKPIEFTYRDVTSALKGSSSIIGQSEVGRHIKSFAMGVHSALRRKPNIIIVGEARDYETIAASLEAALTGHLVYTTTHAGSVSDAIRRLLTAFPANERESRAYDLISTMRFCMVQFLAVRCDKPGRVAIREYLRITPRVREKLLGSHVNEWPNIIDNEVNNDVEDRTPQDMRQSAAERAAYYYHRGIISLEDAMEIGGPGVVENKHG